VLLPKRREKVFFGLIAFLESDYYLRAGRSRQDEQELDGRDEAS